MRRLPPAPAEATAERLLSSLVALTLLACAMISAGLAHDEMILRGAVCGPGGAAHCAWCYAAAAFGVVGLAALAMTLQAPAMAKVALNPRVLSARLGRRF